MNKRAILALAIGSLLTVFPLQAQRGGGGHGGGGHSGGGHGGGFHGGSVNGGFRGNVGWIGGGLSSGAGYRNARGWRNGYWYGGAYGGYWASPFWYDDYGYNPYPQEAADNSQPVPPAAIAQGNDRPATTAPAAPVSPVMMEVPEVKEAAVEQPGPATVFIFKDGARLEARHYTLTQNALHLADEGHERTVALAQLDREATITANQERGIDLRFPTDGNRVVLSF